jgi:hypothetical protein
MLLVSVPEVLRGNKGPTQHNTRVQEREKILYFYYGTKSGKYKNIYFVVRWKREAERRSVEMEMVKPSHVSTPATASCWSSSQLHSSSLCPPDPRKTSAELTCPQVCWWVWDRKSPGLVFLTYSSGEMKGPGWRGGFGERRNGVIGEMGPADAVFGGQPFLRRVASCHAQSIVGT